MNLEGVFTDELLSAVLSNWTMWSWWNIFAQVLPVIKTDIADQDFCKLYKCLNFLKFWV
jgi:hypothetical protein